MELRVLRYFTAVVDEGSITNAAKVLHVTQPTLSRQLSQLEMEMGIPLLMRGRSGIELTDRGAVLNRYARDILALADMAEGEVAMPESSVSGTVHIGAGETSAFTVVAEACVRVRERYPSVSFDVHDGTSADLKEHFARGFYDFLLDCDSGENAEFNQVVLPICDVWGVVMRPDDPLTALEAVRPADLLGRPLITPPQGIGRVLREWAGELRTELERQVACTYGLPLNTRHLVSGGMGVMLTYDGLVSDAVQTSGSLGSLCFRPLTPRVEATHKVLWRKAMPTKAMQALIDELALLCG